MTQTLRTLRETMDDASYKSYASNRTRCPEIPWRDWGFVIEDMTAKFEELYQLEKSLAGEEG